MYDNYGMTDIQASVRQICQKAISFKVIRYRVRLTHFCLNVDLVSVQSAV